MASDRPWLESLAACLPHAVVFVREDGSILWSNRNFCELVHSDGSLKGAAFRTFLTEWELISGSDRIEGLVTGLKATDGTDVEVLVHGARCKPGLEARWAVHLQDRSAFRQLETQLKARERSYSFLRENTSDMIVRLDTDLRIVWASDACPSCLRVGGRFPDLVLEGEIAALPAPSPEAPGAQADVAFTSRDGVDPPFYLTGAARCLSDESGNLVGFTLLLRDQSEKQAFARFARKHNLSSREEEVLLYVVQGYSNLNIASILGLSESGVKFHLRNVFNRARVATRTELMAAIMEH